VPVVDASLAVALLQAGDPFYRRAWRWVFGFPASDMRLMAPTLLVPEVAAAIGRGVGEPELARRAVELLLRGLVIDLHPLDASLSARRGAVAIEGKLRGADAVYVALAEQMGAKLVTFDRQQLQRGAAFVDTLEPAAD
jgi:predicted nucleic acid-binding protein